MSNPKKTLLVLDKKISSTPVRSEDPRTQQNRERLDVILSQITKTSNYDRATPVEQEYRSAMLESSKRKGLLSGLVAGGAIGAAARGVKAPVALQVAAPLAGAAVGYASGSSRGKEKALKDRVSEDRKLRDRALRRHKDLDDALAFGPGGADAVRSRLLGESKTASLRSLTRTEQGNALLDGVTQPFADAAGLERYAAMKERVDDAVDRYLLDKISSQYKVAFIGSIGSGIMRGARNLGKSMARSDNKAISYAGNKIRAGAVKGHRALGNQVGGATNANRIIGGTALAGGGLVGYQALSR